MKTFLLFTGIITASISTSAGWKYLPNSHSDLQTLIEEQNCETNSLENIAEQIHALNDLATSSDRSTVYQYTSVDSAKINELRSFYNNEDFPKNLSQEIKASNMMAGDAINTESLKNVVPDKCDTLIDQIASTVRAKITPMLLEGPKDIQQACPRWSSLSNEDKKDFYVGLITAMAMAESSCNNRARNGKASNGVAYGAWQATKQMSPVQGASWAMNQVKRQIEKSGLLFWKDSNQNYWAVLNPNIHAYKVKGLLKKIPACVVDAAVKSYAKK